QPNCPLASVSNCYALRCIFMCRGGWGVVVSAGRVGRGVRNRARSLCLRRLRPVARRWASGGRDRTVLSAESIRSRPSLGNQAEVEAEDRKSTRLNSSHVSISYDVFCLTQKQICFIIYCIYVINFY